MNKSDIQNAITLATMSGLPAVTTKAFIQKKEGWVPRPKCLEEYYSSGERVICSILLCFYFEFYGRPNAVVVPNGAQIENAVTDIIWPGAWYFYTSRGTLTNIVAWDSIGLLLPGDK